MRKNTKTFFCLKDKIEALLQTFGVDPAACHGGDLVGNHCRLLLQNSSEAFASIKQIIKEHVTTENKGEGLIEKVMKRCDATAQTLTTFDSLFSILHTPNKDINNDVITKAKIIIKKAGEAWWALKDNAKNISPKVHLILDHVEKTLLSIEGLGDFDELFVERNHQCWVKHYRLPVSLHLIFWIKDPPPLVKFPNPNPHLVSFFAM